MASGFIDTARVEHTPPWADDYNGLESVVLLNDLRYVDRDGIMRGVPAGFRSDGASVPRLFRWAVPRWNRTLYAGLLHDYLIRCRVVDDRRADREFYRALRVSGVGFVSAVRMYLAVRLGSCVRAFERAIGHCGWVRACSDESSTEGSEHA